MAGLVVAVFYRIILVKDHFSLTVLTLTHVHGMILKYESILLDIGDFLRSFFRMP